MTPHKNPPLALRPPLKVVRPISVSNLFRMDATAHKDQPRKALPPAAPPLNELEGGEAPTHTHSFDADVCIDVRRQCRVGLKGHRKRHLQRTFYVFRFAAVSVDSKRAACGISTPPPPPSSTGGHGAYAFDALAPRAPTPPYNSPSFCSTFM